MTSMTLLCTTTLLLAISSTCAGEFFQEVEGKCSEIPVVKTLDPYKVAVGEWYFPYASFAKEGDKCGSGRCTEREPNYYFDLLLFDSKNNTYISVHEDFTYDPEKPGIYSSKIGVTKYVVASDLDKWLYCVQCLEQDGKTKVMALLATRARKVDKKTKKAYKKINAMLAEKKLLPTMRDIPLSDCPPLSNIVRL